VWVERSDGAERAQQASAKPLIKYTIFNIKYLILLFIFINILCIFNQWPKTRGQRKFLFF